MSSLAQIRQSDAKLGDTIYTTFVSARIAGDVVSAVFLRAGLRRASGQANRAVKGETRDGDSSEVPVPGGGVRPARFLTGAGATPLYATLAGFALPRRAWAQAIGAHPRALQADNLP